MSAAAEQLRKWAARNGRNATDAADAIGCQWGQLRDWSNGSAVPGLAWAVRLRDVTGIAIEAWVVEPKPKRRVEATAAKRRAKRAA